MTAARDTTSVVGVHRVEPVRTSESFVQGVMPGTKESPGDADDVSTLNQSDSSIQLQAVKRRWPHLSCYALDRLGLWFVTMLWLTMLSTSTGGRS